MPVQREDTYSVPIFNNLDATADKLGGEYHDDSSFQKKKINKSQIYCPKVPTWFPLSKSVIPLQLFCTGEVLE